MIEYYRKRAKEYDLVYAKPERQQDLIFISQFLQKVFSNKDVLDVGCGTGYWSEKIAATCSSIYGIDINQSVLDIAINRNYNNVPFRFDVLDYYDLNKMEQKFSGIFCGFVWSHIYKKDLEGYISKLLTPLKKEELLIIIDNKYVEGSSTPISRNDEMGNTFQNRKLNNEEIHEVLKNFPSKKELETLFHNKVSSFKYIELEYYWIVSVSKSMLD